jgi:SPP1 gp7 family putative phage head morphogenesis protein
MSDLPDIDDLWDDSEEKSRFRTVMLPFLLAGFLDGAGLYGIVADPESLLTPAKKTRLSSKSLAYAAAAARTTKKSLARQIDLAIENGESVKQLGKRIDRLFGSSMGFRSQRIARTQLTETINIGTHAALEDEGNLYKEWSTVIDGRERHSHHKANGQIVGIDEKFTLDGGSCMAPGDDSLPPEEKVNCRCTIVAAGITPSRKRALGQLFLRTHSSLERRYVISLRRAFRAQRDRITSRLPS